ncbi:sulfotransferase 1C4-like [Clavelina lepadiformis]|uniref:sulfotransferase 1C4-like n=1 Tax=Clavelina lepadiformis TaxID=159417 RepID=UPI00404344AE
MEKLADILSTEEIKLMKTIEETKLPENPQLELWKGYQIIPAISPQVIEYFNDNFPIRKGDVFICSYPKTGSNWTYEVVRQILFQDKESDEMTKILPYTFKILGRGPSDKYKIWEKLPLSRRLFYTHLPPQLMNLEKLKKAGAKIVYVCRNPKDQTLSWYRYGQKLPWAKHEPMKSMIGLGWNKFYEHCIKGDFPQNNKPGEWYPEHIQEWYKQKDDVEIRFVFYEDMKKNLTQEVKKLSEFLDVSLAEDVSRKIAKKCTFTTMKRNVLSETTQSAKTIAGVMVKGEVGRWKNYFTAAQSQQIDDIIEKKLATTQITFTYTL